MKAVFFDLDGTLLPMDIGIYLKSYFDSLSDFFCKTDAEKKHLHDVLLTAIYDTIANDGTKTNREVYLDAFARASLPYDEALYDEYYNTDFIKSMVGCHVNPKSKELIEHLKLRGIRIVLATNPLYPASAMEARVKWAGLEVSDFEYITSYENSSYAKPNPKYFSDIAFKLGLDPLDCLMVGNDMKDDINATESGMKMFFITDCIVNVDEERLKKLPHGDFDALTAYIDELFGIK